MNMDAFKLTSIALLIFAIDPLNTGLRTRQLSHQLIWWTSVQAVLGQALLHETTNLRQQRLSVNGYNLPSFNIDSMLILLSTMSSLMIVSCCQGCTVILQPRIRRSENTKLTVEKIQSHFPSESQLSRNKWRTKRAK